MSTVPNTSQEAADAMILNQGKLQLAQVKYNNSKVKSENIISLHLLHEFQKALHDMKVAQALLKKKRDAAKFWGNVVKAVVITFAVIGVIGTLAAGQPELAALIIVTTTLSLAPSGKKGETCMDVIVKWVASKLPGGDTPANEIWASVIIAVVVVVLTCGSGALSEGVTAGSEAASDGAMASVKAGIKAVLSRLGKFLPMGGTMTLMSAGFTQNLVKELEKDKAFMKGFTQVVDGFIDYVNAGGPTCGLIHFNIKKPNAHVIKMILILTVTVVFLVITAASSVATMKMVGTATLAASTAGEASAGAADSEEGGAGEATEAAGEDATAGSSEALSSEKTVLQRATTRMADFFSRVTSYIPRPSLARLGVIMSTLFILNAAVDVGANTVLGINQISQGNLIEGQGKIGVTKNTVSFQLKLISMIADQDSKALHSQWKGDAAMQQVYSEFSADTGAIANALLG